MKKLVVLLSLTLLLFTAGSSCARPVWLGWHRWGYRPYYYAAAPVWVVHHRVWVPACMHWSPRLHRHVWIRGHWLY